MIKRFATYLKDIRRMQARIIPYYLKWVKNAYTHSHSSLKIPITEEAKGSFLNHSLPTILDFVPFGPVRLIHHFCF